MLIMISPITLISQWLRRQTRQGHQLTQRGNSGKTEKANTKSYVHNKSSVKVINGFVIPSRYKS